MIDLIIFILFTALIIVTVITTLIKPRRELFYLSFFSATLVFLWKAGIIPC